MPGKVCSFGTGIVAAIALFSSTAWAYIPPSQYVVRAMTAKRSGLKTLRVQGTISRLDSSGKPSDTRFKEVMSYDSSTRLLRSIALDDSGRELYRLERKLQDPALREPPFAARIGELLLALHGEGLTQTLLALGVPIRTDAELASMKNEDERRAAESTQLKRWKSTVAWVIGRPSPRDPQRAVPQLWVEKDSFLPVRFVALSDGTRNEWVFENYRYFREIPFPRQTTWIRGEEPRLRADVTDVQVNGTVPELKTNSFERGFTDAGNQADSRLRDLIQSYYEWVR